ncbi:MAG: DsbA family protein [Acidobacteriales bacterium]|nr:DsbA family protein [Terriglobales bacterium]
MNSQRRNLTFIVSIGIVAVLAAGAVILISSNSATGSSRDYSSIPQSRTEDGAFVLGNPEAPITIVEFADFTCPHCQEYAETVHRFIDEFVATGQAKFEYRMFPIVHPQYAEFTAELAECAAELSPGSFWNAHDLIFQLAGAGRYDAMGRLVAERFGLDYSALLECASDARQHVTDMNLGRQVGVQGTPAVLVRYGDQPLSWINLNGQEYNRGGVSYNVLSEVVQQAQ